MQNVPAAWLAQLDELLALTDMEQNASGDVEQEARLVERVAALDPDLLTFLIDQLAQQESAQGAALLELLAAGPATPAEARAHARGALEALAEQGISPAPPGAERFYAGWVQEGRERGEQILILGWRLAAGDLEALVFLLDWRGDGLKDFYRTRRMNAGEWHELLAHNGDKGARLVELTLAEARALLEDALAESRRFSRPLPREYKLESALIERRRLTSVELPAPPTRRAFVSPSLSPEAVVRAYVAALHHRDYMLAALLLAPEHPLRAGRTLDEAAADVRAQLKHAPRREEAVEVSTPQDGTGNANASLTVEAVGAETAIERHTNRRLRQVVAERYALRKTDDGWRIVAVSLPS